MATKPAIVQQQFDEMDALRLAGVSLSEAEYRARFPEAIAWVNANVSLVDLIQESGIKLKPLSPDSPGVYVSESGCLCCGGPIVVKDNRP